MKFLDLKGEIAMRTAFLSLLSIGCLFSMEGCMKKAITQKAPAAHIRQQFDKFVPVSLGADLSRIPPNEAEAVRLLVKTSRIMDGLFLLQVDENNPSIRGELERSKEADASVYLDFFDVMFGSWDRLDAERPFLNGKPKPPGAAFYPVDMTKEEFASNIKAHPDLKDAFESSFTVIRWKGKELEAIPYSKYFLQLLKPAAELLKQAAGLTSDSTLKRYLDSRADAFLSNDYYSSDLAWMDLSGNVEVVIGPYEVYEDALFGYKAAFEAFVCLTDLEESGRQNAIAARLVDLENALPLPESEKGQIRGTFSPIKVVNLVYSAGDAKKGVQTLAFNLPNDERVRLAKGSKKVMLKNVMRAKFEKCWMPIVREALTETDLGRVSFDAYFAHTLMHEVSHGLGPGILKKNGRETTVQKELKELYPVIEECKADVLGLLTAQLLIDWNVFPKSLESSLYATNLGGLFRSIRFGVGEAHGGGVAIQMNFFMDRAAFSAGPDGRFSVDDGKMKSSIGDLARELLQIEAAGDYQGAESFIRKYRTIRPEVEKVLAKMKDIPVDIRPVYAIENEIR
jgi:hypothetical protein